MKSYSQIEIRIFAFHVITVLTITVLRLLKKIDEISWFENIFWETYEFSSFKIQTKKSSKALRELWLQNSLAPSLTCSVLAAQILIRCLNPPPQVLEQFDQFVHSAHLDGSGFASGITGSSGSTVSTTCLIGFCKN